MILGSLTAAIGCTPQVRLRSLEQETPGVELWAKLEWFNPGGSVKDRAAFAIVKDALARGLVEPGGKRVLLDATSGNTGISYAWICAALGVPVALVMPENVSESRKRLTKLHGARQIFSSAQELSDGSTRLALELARAEPDRWYYADQYSNPNNPLAHRATAAEIWADTGGRVTHFLAGLGTSGTCLGTGRGLRERSAAVEVIAVEPAEALHGFEGMRQLATSMVPALYRAEELTRTLFIPTDEGWDMADRLLDQEGLLAGHSAGANAAAALRLAKELHAAGKTGCVVTVFPDKADRYLPAAAG